MSKNLLLTGKLIFTFGLTMVFLDGYSQALSSLQISRGNNYEVQGQSPERMETLRNVLKDIENIYNVHISINDKDLDNKFIGDLETLDKIKSGEIKNIDQTLIHILNPLSLQIERVKDNIYLIYQMEELKNVPRKSGSSVKEHGSGFNMQTMSSLNLLQYYTSRRAPVETPVKGRVTSEQGEGLPGVSVAVKGTTIGTVTDVDGNYSLTVPDANSVLVFSFIGYTSQEQLVGGKSEINIQLVEDLQKLSEVVVVGYGTQRKQEVTQAITTLKAEDFNKGNVNDVSQLLQGKVAGLTITRPGGNPNQAFSIRLRGVSTIGPNSQPLVVVDGAIGADLNSVDPNDIASIDVLKDGSAAAIYGTRGSAGVIIITTKRGKEGKPRIDYNGYVTSESMSRHIPVMNREEYLAAGGKDLGADTDWYKEITRTAYTHVHNLSISGGTPNTTYRASLNYRDGQGVLITTGFEQLNARLNLTQKALNDRLSISFDIAQTNRDSDIGWYRQFRDVASYNPTAPVRSPDAEFEQYGGYFQQQLNEHYNPVAYLKQNSNATELNRLNLNLQAEIEIVKNLKLQGRFATQRQNQDHNIFIDKYSNIDSRDANSPYEYGGTVNGVDLNYQNPSLNGVASKRNVRNDNRLIETTLNYSLNVGENIKIGLLGGYSYQYFKNQGTVATGGDIISNILASNNLLSVGDFPAGRGYVASYLNDNKLVAFFGRANVNFNETFFLMASLRREGSSMFGENNKWGNFPAVSGGVDISKLVEIPVISNLKLRASYGVTGALPRDPYLSIPTVQAQNQKFFYNGNYITSYGPARNANPDLKWETKGEFDIGLDFALLSNKLSGSFDYYDRKTSDFIYYATVSRVVNNSEFTWLNLGSIRSKGVELALSYNVIDQGDFKWTTGGNFSSFDVTLESLSNEQVQTSTLYIGNMGSPGLNATNVIRVREGDKLGNIFGPVFDGLDESGKFKYKDISGDGVYTRGAVEDQEVLGNGLPKFTLGFTNTIVYKNFDLNFFLRGAFGHDIVNSYRAFYEYPKYVQSYNIVNTKHYDPNVSVEQDAEFSSRFVEKGDFVKLDNATLGYNFNISGGKIFKTARVYINGQNLFVITGYTGVDPEPRFTDPDQTGANAVLSAGIERRRDWIQTRSFTIGVNFGL
jgi:TonB-dependent starch-binding outer membrane protein SusC